MIPTLLVTLLLLAVTPPVSAQLYPIENLEEADGLPSPLVKDIVQDHFGRVWVATRGGLTHFDGVGWHTENLDSLVHDNSNALLARGPQRNAWALFSGQAPTLLTLPDGDWHLLPLPPSLATGTHDFSHFAVGQDGERPVPLICQLPGTIWRQDQDGWRRMDLAPLGISQVTDLITVGNVFYLATPQGLYRLPSFPRGRLEAVEDPTLPGPVLCLSPGVHADTLWLVGADWIGLSIHGRIDILHDEGGGLFGAFVEAEQMICRPDGYGGLYLAGGTITQYYHPDRGLENLGPRNGLLDNKVSTLFRDRENVMWLGTQNGISKILNRHVRSYTGAQGLLEDEVTALLRKRDGTVVIGHPTGLTLWNGAMEAVPFRNPDLRDRVLDLAEDDAGDVWIAGRFRGLGRLSPDGKLRWWAPSPEFPDYFVSVMQDSKDRIWVAASDRLLVMEDGRLRTHLLPAEWQDAAYLRRLILGHSERVYIATGNIGVLAFEEGGLRQWNTGVRDHGNSVFDVLESRDGRMWAGTRAGLYLMQNNHLVRPEESRYRIESPVYFLENDLQDRLWAGTDNGVLLVDDDQVRHFTVETGLIGRETNRCASLVDARGRVWVGTERGLNIFDPRFEGTDPMAPLVSLLELEAEGFQETLVDGPDRIELPRAGDNLVIRFRAITTTESHRLRVRTRLDGLDEDWIEVDNPDNRIRYANLGPGTYRFHIQAAGFGQPWSEVVSSPLIHVPTPFLQSPWVIVPGVLVLLPLYMLFKRRFNSRLKAEVARQVEDIRRTEQERE